MERQISRSELWFMIGSLFLAFSQWPFFWSQLLQEVRLNIGVNVGLTSFFYFTLSTAIAFITYRNWRSLSPYVISVIGYVLIAIAGIHLSGAHWKTDFFYLSAAVFALSLSSTRTEVLRLLANAAIFIYIALSLPSVLIFLGKLFWIAIPHTDISLLGRPEILYPFGLIVPYGASAICDNHILVRIQGYSDEPGVLGTYAVFFLILNHFVGFKKYQTSVSIILHVLGTLSFSLFYLVSAWVFLLPAALWRLRTDKAAKSMLIGIAAGGMVLLALPLFSKAQCGDASLVLEAEPIRRLLHGDPQLGRNDRAQFDFLAISHGRSLIEHGQWKDLFIGKVSSAGTLSGWTAILYSNGLLGVATTLLFFVYIALRYPAAIIILLPAMLSFYQRQDFAIVPMMAIFWVTMTRFMPQAQRSTCPVPALNHF